MERCETCRFRGEDKDEFGDDAGDVCRRRAPVPKSETLGAHWPLLDVDIDWCGEYEPKDPDKAEVSGLLSRLRASGMSHDDIARRLRAMLNAAGGS